MTVEQTTKELNTELNHKKNYTTLWLMIILFGLPYVAAYYFYYHADKDILGEQTNYGTIVSPVRPVSDIALKKSDNSDFRFSNLNDSWVFVLIGNSNCPQICQDNLYKMRQIRKAVGKNQYRIERVFLLKDTDHLDSFNKVMNEYEGTEVIIPSNDNYSELLSSFSLTGESTDNRIFIIDPLGNYMMAYPENADTMKILKDIERLLKVSQVGRLL